MTKQHPKKPKTPYELLVKYSGIAVAIFFYSVSTAIAHYLYFNAVSTTASGILFYSEIIFYIVSLTLFAIFLQDL